MNTYTRQYEQGYDLAQDRKSKKPIPKHLIPDARRGYWTYLFTFVLPPGKLPKTAYEDFVKRSIPETTSTSS